MLNSLILIFKQTVRRLALIGLMLSTLPGAFTYRHPFTDKIADTSGLAAAEGKSGGLVVNVDINSTNTPFLNACAADGVEPFDDLYAYVDQYDNTQVTDLAFNVFCQYSATPSDVWTDSVAKYLQTSENGTPVDYRPLYEGIYRFYQNGIDPYAVWFERCRTDGIHPWLSIRMNDCHEPDEAAGFLRSDFFYEAREKGWMIGSDYGYYRNCFDYAVPEVRQKMLDYTAEQLARYDVYGIELDFMREITCFNTKKNQDCAAVMTAFMRDMKAVVDAAGAKWGHTVKIMARLPRDIEQSLAYGFDAAIWAREGLADILVITPRWASCDSAMPLADWAAKCPGVELYAGIETLVVRQSGDAQATAEVVRGFAAQYLTAGADKIYLYNYYQNPRSPEGRSAEIYATCGQLHTALNAVRRHIVTYQDIAPDGYEKYEPLPLKVTAYNSVELRIETGFIPPGAKVHFIIGTSTPQLIGKLKAAANGEACAFTGETALRGTPALNNYSGDAALYRYEMPAEFAANLQKLRFENTGIRTVEITYAEIVVEF